jgi:MGT family glycosyltransferase
VTICCGLPLFQEAGVPPGFTLWPYQKVWWARLRNQLGYQIINLLTRPLWQQVLKQREHWRLPPYRCREDAYSPLAQICQIPQALDFPREKLPPWFHYVGSLKSPTGIEPVSANDLDFPFEKLNGKPLIYASIGTLQNRNWNIFRTISEACLDLDVQLLIDMGDPAADPTKTDFPGALVFPFPPLQKIIGKASLVITHGGTIVINCLQSGVPMVTIPITSDHSGTAARIARVGAGEIVTLKNLSVATLRAAIEKVLCDQNYRDNAIELAAEIKKSGGVSQAVNVIEQAIETRKPVLST